MIREINSTTNPFVKHIRGLVRSKKLRKKSGSFVIEGWRGIDSLLQEESPFFQLKQLVVSNDWKNDSRLPATVEIVMVPDFVFTAISDVQSAQGILGVVTMREVPFSILPEAGNYLLLDRLRDPGNLGTLIRSAVGAGFDGVLLYGDCAEVFNPKVVRSTMGTLAFSKVWKIGMAELEQMLAEGYDLCVTAGVGGKNLYQTSFGAKNILVVGSEAHGVADDLMARATQKITIPIASECESLNAAIAGSICMFQIKNSN